MALFRDLIRAIADAEGVSEMSVTGVGQYLRDAGFISKHGRGKAAAQMTSQDAANLLIGVNATDLAKDAPAVVKAFNLLDQVEQIVPALYEEGEEDPFGRAMHQPGNAVQCLTTVIDLYREKEGDGYVHGVSAILTFKRPVYGMSLWFGYHSEGEDDPGEAHCALTFKSRTEDTAAGDRYNETSITEVTLTAVAEALAK